MKNDFEEQLKQVTDSIFNERANMTENHNKMKNVGLELKPYIVKESYMK